LVFRENMCERERERERERASERVKGNNSKSSGFQATPPSAMQMLKLNLRLYVTAFTLTEPQIHTSI